MRHFWQVLLVFLVAAGIASAQQPARDGYPSRAVTIIVPFAPGGTADAVPRIVADRLRERWRQPVIIENRPGNAGNIGAALVSRAEPNGYTLLACPAGTLVINQFVQKKMPFDPEKLVPVALLSKLPIALSVRASLPVNSVSELIAYARQNPGKLNYATQGPGSTAHLTTVMFQTMTGVDLVHVPYKGSAPALADLIAGTVDMMFDTYTSSASHHKAGKLKLLAIASARRLPNLPNVPTVREAGLTDFESSTWNGMLAPPGTPEAIAEVINLAVNEALAAPETRAKLLSLGIDPAGGTREDMSNFMKQERRRWEKVVRAANIPLQ